MATRLCTVVERCAFVLALNDRDLTCFIASLVFRTDDSSQPPDRTETDKKDRSEETQKRLACQVHARYVELPVHCSSGRMSRKVATAWLTNDSSVIDL